MKKMIFWEDLALLVWLMLLLTSCNNSAIQEKLNQLSNYQDEKELEDSKVAEYENQGAKNGSDDVISNDHNGAIYFNSSGDAVSELEELSQTLSEEQIFEEFMRNFNWLERIKTECWLDGQKNQVCKLDIDLKNYIIFYAQNKTNQRCNFNQSVIVLDNIMEIVKGCEGEFDVFILNINLIRENKNKEVESYVEKLTRTPDIKIEEEIKILDQYFQ